MSKNLRHAQILAAIAAEVVQQHRDAGSVPTTAPPTVPTASTTSHDPSWDFRIPERCQG